MGQQAFATDATWSAGAVIMIVVTFLGFLIYDALWKSGLAITFAPAPSFRSSFLRSSLRCTSMWLTSAIAER